MAAVYRVQAFAPFLRYPVVYVWGKVRRQQLRGSYRRTMRTYLILSISAEARKKEPNDPPRRVVPMESLLL
jgi:hypothetical protein